MSGKSGYQSLFPGLNLTDTWGDKWGDKAGSYVTV